MSASEQHALLDELYWNTKQTVTSLCAQFGLTSTQMQKLITPLPAGFDCWWCQNPVTYRKRSDRERARQRYTYLTCECGAEQPDGVDHPGLTDTDAAIVAPLFEARSDFYHHGGRRSRQEGGPMSDVVRLGVKALAEVGLRWAGAFVVVEAFDSVDSVADGLAALPTRTLVIPALTDVMRNEGDSLALFFRLVSDGWRVISAVQAQMHRDQYDGWCTDLVEPWSRRSESGSRFARLHVV